MFIWRDVRSVRCTFGLPTFDQMLFTCLRPFSCLQNTQKFRMDQSKTASRIPRWWFIYWIALQIKLHVCDTLHHVTVQKRNANHSFQWLGIAIGIANDTHHRPGREQNSKKPAEKQPGIRSEACRLVSICQSHKRPVLRRGGTPSMNQQEIKSYREETSTT